MDLAALKNAFLDRDIRKVKVGGFDVDGVLRGKYVSLEKFWSVAEPGFGFCDVIFGWDIADVLYDNAKVTGWHSGYPDTHAVIDLDTFRELPAEPHTAAFLVDFVEKDGGGTWRGHPACPRSLLKQVLARAAKMGLSAKLGAEFEFWVFKETPASLHEKDFRRLQPISPGMFGYSWLREEQNAAFCHAILDEMAAFDVGLEALHTETGPGVYEVAIRYDDALRAADKAALFKTQLKALAARHGLAVTFMAKWNHDLPGSSGHLHQSLWSTDAKQNVFYDAAAPDQLSKQARQYIAGQVELMPELTALCSPTVNSYKRYVPGVWAPLTASWGIENRTCAIRVIPGGPSATRIEYRQTAADINPYTAMATTLAAGLWGIEQKLEAPSPISGDALASPEVRPQADRQPEGPSRNKPLPRTLKEATALLGSSERARQILGEAFVDHYVRTRDWEVRQFERVVTDWELRRYFESI